jgi:hypothetical protein
VNLATSNDGKLKLLSTNKIEAKEGERRKEKEKCILESNTLSKVLRFHLHCRKTSVVKGLMQLDSS